MVANDSTQPTQTKQDPSPQLSTHSYTFTSPLSPAHLPSPHRYEFEYGIQPSALSQSNLQQWNGTNGEQQMFATNASETLYGNPYGTYAGLDGYGGYDPNSQLSGGVAGPSTTPPSSTFDAVGLPFRGLDFIRNYNPSGYVTGDQDSLWQSYDPGAFGYDPDLPFTLGDTPNEVQDTIHQS